MQKLITNKKFYIIVITGDLIDASRYDLDNSMDFVKEAVNIAPTYFVSGNHEVSSGNYLEIIEALESAGVIVLENVVDVLNKNNEQINLIGIKDYNFYLYDGTDAISQEFKNLVDENNFNILLSHRPELFDIYVEQNIDLVFTGHAHGGQINIPFIGDIIAPDQGLFPEYTSGMYEEDNTSMYVSCGLGNSIIPLRIFNNPEVVFVTLKTI